ncbi:irregular chiasm C-roughest protein-like isoform X2 [Macrobrachium rosenbergii]|uniref:irregular chiasm C-roughest protein-like isoform X2 n=1 Tax=Macrobrachium rosenbergii TaxID=79674 RepID=UPI0034D6D688
MFTWWISWFWAWLLWWSWACTAGASISSSWAPMIQGDLGAGGVGSGAGLPSLGPRKLGVKKGAVVGPGMGGSAVERAGVEGVQKFATEPTDQTAVVGSTAVLPCRVINKVGHLQWTKDGFGLGTERDLFGFSRYAMIGSDDEGDYSLRIHPVLLEDDALYQCQVSAGDQVPGIRSGAARLTVYVPPEPPEVKPSVLRTTAGMTVSLECESRGGRPAPEIQWVDDSRRESIRTGTTLTTDPMPDGKRVTVRSRLSFTPRRAHHNSSITCLTSNQALTSPLTRTILMSVLFPPEVRLEVRPPFLVEGDDANFICSAQANPSNISYRWFHQNFELENETSRTLTLHKISRDLHQDAIGCEVTNQVGTSKKTTTLHVQYGPSFLSLPRDVAAETGREVVLKCDVDSNPQSSIVWLKEGSPKIIGSGSELRVVVRPSTAGVYKCIATVRGFADLEGSLRVLVKGPPQIVSSSEQQGRMGDTVTIECMTVSIPTPIRITWTYKGRQIDLSDPRYEVVEDQQAEGLRNTLVIHDAENQDFGAYNCSVVNEYGVARKQIRLHKEKTVPVLLLVGGVIAIVIVAVVIASLILCNKRHSNIKDYLGRRTVRFSKGSPVSEKPPTLTSGQGGPLASVDMYSAPSETKMADDLTPTPSHTIFNEISPSQDTKYQAAQTLNRLSGESTHTFIPDLDGDAGRGYVPFVDYSGRDYAPIPNGRRASFSDLGPYANPAASTVYSAGAPDFCTIRRGTRGQELGIIGNLLTPNFHQETSGLPLNGISNPPGAAPLPSSRKSSYSTVSSTNFGGSPPPPPPPPYSKVPKLGSPRGTATSPSAGTATPILSTPGIFVGGGEDHHLRASSPETKFIFSSEAMMKPGTLV